MVTQNNSRARSIKAPKRIQRLAHLLDSVIPLPGGRSVGLEAIVGLIPGIGDVFGALASSYIIAEGIKMGAPKTVVIRMVLNVLIESTIGVVPVIGDLFDMVYKSNIRNINLLTNLEQSPNIVRKKSRVLLFSVFAIGTICLLLIIWVVFRAVMFAGSALMQLFT